MSDLVKTNIEWIGYTQSNWKIGKIRQFFYEGRNRNIGIKNQNLLSLSYGNIVEKDINTSEGLLPASFSTYNIVEQGDIIIRPTDLQNDKVSLRTGLVKERGIITSAYIDLRPYEGVNSNFFHKVLHSYDVCKVFYNMGSGVRQGIGFADIANLVVFVPPLDEQKRIADFLDGKCAQIDEITKDLEEKIAKLETYKKELIKKSVTKGLNPNVSFKDSGIDWLGKIPSHWRLIPNKYLFVETTDKVGKNWDKYQLLSLSTNGIRLKDVNEIGGKMPDNYEKYLIVHKGQIIFCLFDLDMSAVFSGISQYDGMITSAYNAFYTTNLIEKRYADYFFRFIFINRTYKLYSKNIRYTVTTDVFKSIKTVVPPIDEQKRIADFLDGKCDQIDEITKATRQEIETLKQYKQSLIYEYVTGKKEMPNEQD